jgi:hypothetical protein
MKSKTDFVYRSSNAIPSVKKPGPPSVSSVDGLDTEGLLSKWAPLILGGGAVAVGIYAIKKLQESNTTTTKLMNELKSINQRINTMDSFIKTPTKNRSPSPPVARKVEISVPEPPITIINGDEYEEVEVTDDEQEIDN